MPIHDWNRVDAGLFHAFRHRWVSSLCDVFNTGGLPSDYFALPEQFISGSIPEVDPFARKADRISVRHRHGRVVAVIEIVSPGNKGSQNELRTFVEKTTDLIRHNIHLLVIDLFPPSKRDPQGIHKAIWDEFVEEDFTLPPDKPLTLASYDAGPPRVAYVEPVAVDDMLLHMPLFLKPEFYVLTPLEATYQTTWQLFPAPLKGLLQPPAPPQPGV